MTDEEFEKVQKLYLDECNRRIDIKVKTEQVNRLNNKLALLENDDFMISNMKITFSSSYEYANDLENHCILIDDKDILIKGLRAYRDSAQQHLDELLNAEVSNEQ